MSREAFEAIMAGIEDAGEYLHGNQKGRRVHEIDVGRIDVARLRKDLELTQEQFAKVFRVKAGTIRNWEQGIREPAGPARVLLAVASYVGVNSTTCIGLTAKSVTKSPPAT